MKSMTVGQVGREALMGKEEHKPKRIQRKRTKGWRMPPGAVYVGRPTKWRNMYRVGNGVGCFVTAQGAVDAFRRALEANQQSAERFRLPISQLRGKDLACWCPLDQPCHADVLLEIANSRLVEENGDPS